MEKSSITKALGIMLAIFFGVGICNVFADHCFHKEHRGAYGGYSEGQDLESKFFRKAYFIFSHQEGLSLSEEQVELIKNLKLEVKKELIKQDAEIEVLDLDIESKLHANPIDVEATNALMDRKFEMKKAKAKSLVAAFAKLKGILSEEQYANLKKLWKKQFQAPQTGT